MEFINVMLFVDDQADELHPAPCDTLMVSVKHSQPCVGTDPVYYDFRWSTPVSDQCICELEQLVSTLIQTTVARTVGLQPALF